MDMFNPELETEIPPTLNFSYNWNHKLDCDSFTSIRLSERFEIGKRYTITLKGKYIATAELVEKKKIFIDQINEFIARLDTGYHRDVCISILKKMYPDADWSAQPLYLLLFVKLKDQKFYFDIRKNA